MCVNGLDGPVHIPADAVLQDSVGTKRSRSRLLLSPNSRACSPFESPTMLLHYVCLHPMHSVRHCHWPYFPMKPMC